MASRTTGDDATLPGDDVQRREETAVAPGASVDRYLVLAKVGAGGMGSVFSAYDPELDRKVAIKLLHPATTASGNTEGRTRLMREAQALAKLSHPNVVAVYDVGTVDDRVWMAMEFIKGRTLGTWLEEAKPGWREVVEVMQAAGEGLAAAHTAGLLHRDFKPDNVMLDADGRVRVMDFGLARTGSDQVPRVISGLDAVTTEQRQVLRKEVTRIGAVMGTPGYMSPEQLGGQEVDARSDQFAYCVTLWEALFGQRPFSGNTAGELAAKVLAGERDRPPAGRRVPGWLRRACERGLACEPERRFESMRALLDTLARGQARGRQRTGLAVIGVLVAAGLAAHGVQRWRVAQRVAACEAEAASIDEVWNDQSRQALRDGILDTKMSYAATTADKVESWIDRETQAWRAASTQACTKATVDEQWDTDLHDRATWCLQQHRWAIASLVDLRFRAGGKGVSSAVQVAAGLEPSEACLDTDALRREPTPPEPSRREAVGELHRQIARANMLSQSGRFEEAMAVLDAIDEEANAAGWPPTTALFHIQRGWLLRETDALEPAKEETILAYRQAAEGGDWAAAARAATTMVDLLGHKGTEPDLARLWAVNAEVAVHIAGDPLGLREASRLRTLARVEASTGDHTAALALDRQALALQEEALGPEHPMVAITVTNMGTSLWAVRDFEGAEQAFQKSLAIIERELGPEHPYTANVLNNLAALRWADEDYPRAIELYERVLEMSTEIYGPEHSAVATALDNLALVHGAMGDYDEAVAIHDRSLALWKKTMGPDHPHVAVSYGIRGDIEHDAKHLDGAIAAFEEAVRIYDIYDGVQDYELSVAQTLAELLLSERGDVARARALSERARQGYAAQGEAGAQKLAEIDAWIAENLDAEGEAGDAATEAPGPPAAEAPGPPAADASP